MDQAKELLPYITLGSVLVSIALGYSKKNTSQDIDATKLSKDLEAHSKDITHINQDISEINHNLTLLRENGINHIERDLNEVKVHYAGILGSIGAKLDILLRDKNFKLYSDTKKDK